MAFDGHVSRKPHPPTLAPMMRSHVFFTDLESVSGHYSAEGLATRLTLSNLPKFKDNGALIVIVPLGEHVARIPDEGNGPEPETRGGAKQWITESNIPFSTNQLLYWALPTEYVLHEYADIEEANKAARWEFLSPRLSDENFWRETINTFTSDQHGEDIVPRNQWEIGSLLEDP